MGHYESERNFPSVVEFRGGRRERRRPSLPRLSRPGETEEDDLVAAPARTEATGQKALISSACAREVTDRGR